MRRFVSLFAVACALATPMLACGGKKPDSTSPNDGGKKSENPPDPTKASVEAKADFAKVADRYKSASAGGKLAPAQCESFARDFEKLYQEHGKTMTIAWFNAGAVWESCGDVKKAEEIYQSIIKKVPSFDLAYNNLGVIYWNRRQEEQALDYFKRAVEANSKTRAPRNNLAAALRNEYSEAPDADDFTKAERYLQSVLAVDSSNRLAYENLARLYYDRGRLKDKSYLLLADLVVTQATRVLKEKSIESSDLYNIKGLLYMEQENQVDALRAFKKATEVEPNHADANLNLAMISIRFRDYGQAEKSLNIALQDGRQKKNIETYLGLGVAQRGLRKYKDAEEAFKKAMEMSGEDPRPLYNLGILYQEHVATAQEGEFSKVPYETAKEYFAKFSAKASGNQYKESLADAKTRVANIDQLFLDIAEMQKLQADADRIAAEAKKAEDEERKRLLDLERQAKEADAAASAEPAAEPPAADPAPAPAPAEPPKT